jgi:hypothetical protein
LISKVGDDEVRSGASVHEYEGLTQPACNYVPPSSVTVNAKDIRAGESGA